MITMTWSQMMGSLLPERLKLRALRSKGAKIIKLGRVKKYMTYLIFHLWTLILKLQPMSLKDLMGKFQLLKKLTRYILPMTLKFWSSTMQGIAQIIRHPGSLKYRRVELLGGEKERWIF